MKKVDTLNFKKFQISKLNNLRIIMGGYEPTTDDDDDNDDSGQFTQQRGD